jgi:hypothetical protein
MMFDEKKRREELNELLCQLLSMRNNDNYRVLDKIISQEKLMIAQAKKEAREEFVEKLKAKYLQCGVDDSFSLIDGRVIYKDDIDDILTEYKKGE